jgi:hypothetical protein
MKNNSNNQDSEGEANAKPEVIKTALSVLISRNAWDMRARDF